ncbi:hypothetical protein CARUB_v10022192mg, partial [Capsella rubella]
MESADKGLLVKSDGEEEEVREKDGFVREMKRLGYIAGPMVAVNLSMDFLQVISIVMVGHLGELFLSSTAIAVSFCSATGFSLVFLIMLSGVLPNSKLETSVLSVCTRVANELGAGNPKQARIAVYTVMVITCVESIMVSASVFGARNVFGYLFSSEAEVVDYVRSMAPLVALLVIFDALHTVLSGVARGSGRQDIGAYVNLAAYYLCGIPTAIILAFGFKMEGRGLWIGITVGSFVQAVLLGLIVSLTNWEQQFGLASALETLCGQAHGAKQFEKLGVHTYTGIFSLFLVCIPLSVLWTYMGDILSAIGQDPLVAQEAGRFATWLIPALFGYATLQSLVRFFQAQSLILPLIMSSISALCVHIVLCWSLVFKFGLGSLGAAIAIGASYWLNVTVLGLYMMFSSSCSKSRAPISMSVFKGMGEFFRFGIPSASMICLEWWSFEFLVMLSGILPNPKLETSVLSVCTRVANELGAGNPKQARMAVYTVMVITCVESIMVSAIVFGARNVFGYLFSSETEVVDY